MRNLTLFLVPVALLGCAWFSGPTDQPPQIYKPTYVYGATPMGVYMGDPYDLGDEMMGDDLFLPNGEPMTEYQPQTGAPEQEFQMIQGQETLMHDQSVAELKAYNQEQKIGESMEKQYIKQIDQQTHQQPESGINLPTM